MKKVLIISLFLFGCRKTTIDVYKPTNVVDVFKVQNVSVTNGEDIKFNLDTAGKYTLILFDTTTNQVISKERFNGIVGNNIKKIYTTTFNQKSLYLYLTNESNQQIGKTLLTIN